MNISACLSTYGRPGPDPWDDSWGIELPFDHIICREADGTPHTVRELVWPWSAYTKDQRKFALHFYYWNQKRGQVLNRLEVSPERVARIRELQFLMTRQLYYGDENAPRTLETKLTALHRLARFAEARSCTIQDVLTQPSLLDACGAALPDSLLRQWIYWITFLQKLDPATQLGFTLATPKRWKEIDRRHNADRHNQRQHAPVPTRIYGQLINNISDELDDIEAHAPRLIAALREALIAYAGSTESERGSKRIGPELIAKYALGDYLTRRGYSLKYRGLVSLSAAITEAFIVCKLQIHVFSGMRHDEARTLPYHCMDPRKGLHGRNHCLIVGITSKFNKGRRLRTKWVTTMAEGFRAIRLAQQFASVIYESIGIVPSKANAEKDKFPLFPTTEYLPWNNSARKIEERIRSADLPISVAKDALHSRLFPLIEEGDIAELEEIDPFRAWRDEPEFAIGQRWSLTSHQLRRSLALYANASGLVRITSLRRQLQHITREMSLYYGRGSTFCKSFIAKDLDGYKKHIAPEWQDGEDEAAMLSFIGDVLNSKEPMFGGAGNFYQRQRERSESMTREDVASRMKAGLLSYTPGPLGGCTKTGGCDKRKGLALIDISCATDGCKNLVGKHSRIVKVIQLKRAALSNITLGSIEAGMEKEELAALERIELQWRPNATPLKNL
jgi:hypothetical protein